jgi:hypothetical protein
MGDDVPDFDIAVRVILPRVERGIDYGRPRWLLADDGVHRLYWTPGHMTWSSRGQPREWTDGRLTLGRADRYSPRDLETGPRLTIADLRERHAERINEVFGVEVAHLLHPRKTVQWAAEVTR